MFAQQCHQTLCHDVGNPFAQTEVGHQFGTGAVACEPQQFFPECLILRVVTRHVLDAFGTQCLGQQFFS